MILICDIELLQKAYKSIFRTLGWARKRGIKRKLDTGVLSTEKLNIKSSNSSLQKRRCSLEIVYMRRG